MSQIENPKENIRIFTRDHWHCRWCGRPVIYPRSMKYMQNEVAKSRGGERIACYHAHWDKNAAPLLDELGAIARREGYTACNTCHVTDRCSKSTVSREPAGSQNWDGLSQYFVLIATRQKSLLPRDRKFLEALEGTQS